MGAHFIILAWRIPWQSVVGYRAQGRKKVDMTEHAPTNVQWLLLILYWCFWTVMLEKTCESSLDYKEIQPVHPKRNQSWIFFGGTDVEAETPLLWLPDTKN